MALTLGPTYLSSAGSRRRGSYCATSHVSIGALRRSSASSDKLTKLPRGAAGSRLGAPPARCSSPTCSRSVRTLATPDAALVDVDGPPVSTPDDPPASICGATHSVHRQARHSRSSPSAAGRCAAQRASMRANEAGAFARSMCRWPMTKLQASPVVHATARASWSVGAPTGSLLNSEPLDVAVQRMAPSRKLLAAANVELENELAAGWPHASCRHAAARSTRSSTSGAAAPCASGCSSRALASAAPRKSPACASESTRRTSSSGPKRSTEPMGSGRDHVAAWRPRRDDNSRSLASLAGGETHGR